ncbi:MAG TPA: aminoglycoside phosphotransferase family protein [Gemmatimonadales bacterium]|nr:aminoglycoside phosphotransferase family protein [Gemmatimonadales bacterium]
MILELPALLSRLLSPGVSVGRLSFVALHHAKLVFLAFRDRSPDPEFVVTVSSEEEIKRLHDVLTRLYRTIPRLTAESLAIGRLPDGRFIQIQSAVPGMPWVSLAGPLRHDVRRRLYARALDVLRALHAAIDAVPPWHSRISPSGELRRQLDLCRKHGIILSRAALQLAESSVEHLAKLGELACHWQHGDYCTSNLMVAGTDVRIFDFDEFGLTAMPLHDQFGLAFSVHELASAGGEAKSVAEDVQTCVAAAVGARPVLAGYLRGLLMHHLLWHLNLRHDQPAGVGRMRAIMRYLEGFAAAPGSYLVPTAR